MKPTRLSWSHNLSLLLFAICLNFSVHYDISYAFSLHLTPWQCNIEVGYEYHGECKKGFFVIDIFFWHAPVFSIYYLGKFCAFQKILLKVIMSAKFLITFNGWWVSSFIYTWQIFNYFKSLFCQDFASLDSHLFITGFKIILLMLGLWISSICLGWCIRTNTVDLNGLDFPIIWTCFSGPSFFHEY